MMEKRLGEIPSGELGLGFTFMTALISMKTNGSPVTVLAKSIQ